MLHSKKQSGFTAVELLITLFVAAAFLLAAYQLFNLVIKDGGATRSESRASNIAYDYLRRYAASSTTIPCTPSTPLTDSPLSVDGLTSVTMSITVSCLSGTTANLSKVEATITYNNPPQTIKYALLTSSPTVSIVNGDATAVATIDDSKLNIFGGIVDNARLYGQALLPTNVLASYSGGTQ